MFCTQSGDELAASPWHHDDNSRHTDVQLQKQNKKLAAVLECLEEKKAHTIHLEVDEGG
jgi:hypothetical protein